MDRTEKDLPLVSVAMTTYNGEQFLHQQLQSILDQSYRNLEVIISDDGSTDSTIDIIKNFQTSHSNIFFFKNEKGKGIKKNFENALMHCKGTYIALCDQDDYWMPDKIAALVKGIDGYALIYHNSLFVNDNGESLNKTIADKMNCYTGNNPEVFLMHNCISGHATLFHRKLLSIALPFPEARYHDWWLSFIAACNDGVVYLPMVLVHYRQHQTSKTDMLKRKEGFKHQKELKKYAEELEWFTQCALVENSRKDFFIAWKNHYEKRPQQWFSLWLFSTAMKKKKTLYAIPKKGLFGKFLLALKLFWGLKTKKIVG
ncbi:MAG TPA: glycosyltransferase family 2 protein [Ferruginibacter sp.]|nr:glycosyltransferase family 2 protein [Ferruginibacter sp.]